jgi:hypothetical protein
MASGWKIITATKRLGGGPPMKEYFLVAIADRDEAVKARATNTSNGLMCDPEKSFALWRSHDQAP